MINELAGMLKLTPYQWTRVDSGIVINWFNASVMIGMVDEISTTTVRTDFPEMEMSVQNGLTAPEIMAIVQETALAAGGYFATLPIVPEAVATGVI